MEAQPTSQSLNSTPYQQDGHSEQCRFEPLQITPVALFCDQYARESNGILLYSISAMTILKIAHGVTELSAAGAISAQYARACRQEQISSRLRTEPG